MPAAGVKPRPRAEPPARLPGRLRNPVPRRALPTDPSPGTPAAPRAHDSQFPGPDGR